MKLTKCPQCGNLNLGDRWTSCGPHRRMLEQYCDNVDADEVLPDQHTRREFHYGWGMVMRVCNWIGEPRTPEIQKIPKTSSHLYHRAGCYSIYDRYGHDMVLSQGFPSKAAAMPHIQKELQRGLTDADAGPYTALWWRSAGAYDKGEVVSLEQK